MNLKFWAIAFVAVTLSSCAGVTPLKFGSTISDVEALWGKPTQAHTLATGARLIYSYGPAGNNVFVADFDKQGRLLKQYDAMSFPILARVRPGWKRWEVERELGPAFWFTRYRVSSNLSGVYKYDSHQGRKCFYVEYDSQDTVVATVTTNEARPRDLFPGEREC